MQMFAFPREMYSVQLLFLLAAAIMFDTSKTSCFSHCHFHRGYEVSTSAELFPNVREGRISLKGEEHNFFSQVEKLFIFASYVVETIKPSSYSSFSHALLNRAAIHVILFNLLISLLQNPIHTHPLGIIFLSEVSKI